MLIIQGLKGPVKSGIFRRALSELDSGKEKFNSKTPATTKHMIEVMMIQQN